MKTVDVIVVGLGAMGSAATATLAKRGFRVIGLEQFDLGHDRGSSHGKSRIIRTAYYEHSAYVPLAKRAFELWDQLGQESGQTLLRREACLSIGSPISEIVRGVIQAAGDHDLPFEQLDSAQMAKRYPMFRIPPSHIGVLEHQAGVLAVEKGVLAHLQVAEETGLAEIFSNTVMMSYRQEAGIVTVVTTVGEFRCRQLIITAGAWMESILKAERLPLKVMRQVQFWFAKPEHAEKLPIFLLETEQGAFYGLSETPSEDGWKVARHYGAPELEHPNQVDWQVSADDVDNMRRFLADYLPSVHPLPRESQVCLYTLTPSRHFLIDRVPGSENILVAGGFSGHGYKFAPVIGELLADLVGGRVSPWHAKLFHWGRHLGSSDI